MLFVCKGKETHLSEMPGVAQTFCRGHGMKNHLRVMCVKTYEINKFWSTGCIELQSLQPRKLQKYFAGVEH